MAKKKKPEPIEIRQSVMIPVKQLDPVDWNPNEESAPTFTALVENIKEIGFTEPLLVVERPNNRYLIMSGEHRWKAAVILKMPEVPCIVLDLKSEEMIKIANVRMNMLKGKINPVRFTRLFNDLARKYGPDALRRMMALTEDSAFRTLYRDVRKNLSPEMRKRLDATKMEVRDVTELATVVRRIFAEHGQQLKYNLLLFEFGGKTHLMVRCSDRTHRNLLRLAQECIEQDVDINDRVNELLEAYK